MNRTNHPRKKSPTKERLKKMYCVEKKSTREIAQIFKTNQTQVRRWLDRAQISLRSYAEASAITKNGFKEGAKHWNWSGDKVGYQSLHTWVRKNWEKVKGKKPNKCQVCGQEKNLELSNNGIYNREFKNWEWLCRGCHMKKDYKNGQR
jgi:hypothetical protein